MNANQLKAEIFLEATMELGEGPLWHPQERCWYWVDIYQQQLHQADTSGNLIQSHSFDEKVGFAVPTTQGQFICGLENALVCFDPQHGNTISIADISDEPAGNRFNDGKTDPAGRVWGGTMNVDETTRQGSLYSWSGAKLTTHLTQVGVSNGLGWSPDGQVFYYIDSPRRTITAYAFDLANGVLGEALNVINVPESMGFPDGMAVDQQGMLWVAHWDGYAVRCWDPKSGDVVQEIAVPAPRVTSCAFGGATGSMLLITTARVGLDEKTLADYPLSGSLFSAELEVQGLPCTLAKD